MFTNTLYVEMSYYVVVNRLCNTLQFWRLRVRFYFIKFTLWSMESRSIVQKPAHGYIYLGPLKTGHLAQFLASVFRKNINSVWQGKLVQSFAFIHLERLIAQIVLT